MSEHAEKEVNCLDCHQVAPGQNGNESRHFVINTKFTAANCRSCHESIYQQFLHSRHAAAAWAAVDGDKDFTPEQVDYAEQYHPGGVKRPPHPLTRSWKAARPRKAAATIATASASPITTARSALAPPAIHGTRRPWRSPDCPARAANATSGPDHSQTGNLRGIQARRYVRSAAFC